RLTVLVVALGLCLALAGQEKERFGRLPDGRSQSEAILTEDHKKSLEDVAELVALTEQLKVELEKNDKHVLSIRSIRTAEKIEKIAKRVKNRLKRY
ncbi:MAG: hypothetical protein GY953_06015, partial [bacterium]|nr:hypothetical protein [bacterium]